MARAGSIWPDYLGFYVYAFEARRCWHQYPNQICLLALLALVLLVVMVRSPNQALVQPRAQGQLAVALLALVALAYVYVYV